ncbi:hypothetical protein QBC41DRAFT_112893 [Cercophora samala]|uniref:Uncharacterized protein n=1 Tax=Cercophora samala TaxID=330535 RepID=A0AA39ZEI1_9PEZI|nr:hypothetical protein QBC41DRAFT_112893 [Cercophora samala]
MSSLGHSFLGSKSSKHYAPAPSTISPVIITSTLTVALILVSGRSHNSHTSRPTNQHCHRHPPAIDLWKSGVKELTILTYLGVILAIIAILRIVVRLTWRRVLSATP